MKILFIDGHFTYNGWECIHKNGTTVNGDYKNTTKYYYKTIFHRRCTCDVVTKKHSDKMIRVVKQRSSWKTFRILCHELAHWLFDILLPGKLRDKLDNWLDR